MFYPNRFRRAVSSFLREPLRRKSREGLRVPRSQCGRSGTRLAVRPARFRRPAVATPGEKGASYSDYRGNFKRCAAGLRNRADGLQRPRLGGCLPEDEEQDFRQEEIDDQHKNRRNHHGGSGGAADSLGAALYSQALKTSDSGDDETENDWLRQAL